MTSPTWLTTVTQTQRNECLRDVLYERRRKQSKKYYFITLWGSRLTECTLTKLNKMNKMLFWEWYNPDNKKKYNFWPAIPPHSVLIIRYDLRLSNRIICVHMMKTLYKCLFISLLLLNRNNKDFRLLFSLLCTPTCQLHQQAHHKLASAMLLSVFELLIGPFYLLHLLSIEYINQAFQVNWKMCKKRLCRIWKCQQS
jgi:hypothetical protein